MPVPFRSAASCALRGAMVNEAETFGLGLEQDVNRLVASNPLWPRAFAEEAACV
jgi:hypothetical protein